MIKHFGKILTIAATLAALGVSASNAAARPNGPDCEAAQAAAQSEIAAACPCGGPGTHADYVRCVTKKLRELSACEAAGDGKRSCGPVPRQCAGKIRRVASRSACGKPAATVTCCVPKQRDCEGDATPGANASQLRLMIERVEGYAEGAFTPLLKQPVVGALLMSFSGTSAFALLDGAAEFFP